MSLIEEYCRKMISSVFLQHMYVIRNFKIIDNQNGVRLSRNGKTHFLYEASKEFNLFTGM